MNRAESQIAALLDAYCAGATTREQLLAENAEIGAELAEYLLVADALIAARPPDPPPDAVMRRRRVFEDQVTGLRRSRSERFALRRLLTWFRVAVAQTRVATVALSLVFVVLAASGVSAAALAAAPGSPLYDYKLTVERATVQLTAQANRPASYFELAERRISELTSLGPDAEPELIVKVSDSYRMLVREGLDSINSLQGSVGFDYFDAFRNYQVRVRQHGQQLAAIAADIAPVNPRLAAILKESLPAAEPAPDPLGVPASEPTPWPTVSPTRTATAAPVAPTPDPTPAVQDTPTPEPEPTAEPEPEPEVELEGTIAAIGRGALRIGEVTVLVDQATQPDLVIEGEPIVGAEAYVIGRAVDELTVSARLLRVTSAQGSSNGASAGSPTPAATSTPTPTPATTATPTTSPTSTPSPVALATFEYSGYVDEYTGETVTIDGRVIFIDGDGQPAATVTGEQLGVGALVDVSGEVLSDLRLRARSIDVRAGAI